MTMGTSCKMVKSSLIGLPTPSGISFLWNLGFLLGMVLLSQILSGLFLSMSYLSSLEEAFSSVMHIMRDVQSGWVMRSLHLNGSSLFFMLVYVHMWRGVFFNSPGKNPLVWVSGVSIMFLLMLIAFMGYVLPWGQMSYWGATVITSMLSSIPYVGISLVMWLWGDFSISQPMLGRMFSLHFMMPLVLVVLVFVHLLFLHSSGSSNPLGVETNFDKIKFFPYFLLKDFYSFVYVVVFLSVLLSVSPFLLGDPENFSPASVFVTPTHIKPEWYFLFAYAILRCVPSKLGGVLAMLFSVLVVLVFTIKKFSLNMKFLGVGKFKIYMFVGLGCMLTLMGGKSVSDATVLLVQMMTFFYFGLILMY